MSDTRYPTSASNEPYKPPVSLGFMCPIPSCECSHTATLFRAFQDRQEAEYTFYCPTYNSSTSVKVSYISLRAMQAGAYQHRRIGPREVK